jgi:hypothetical protein
MFTKIKAPKFKINGRILNEYELRTLMLEVALGRTDCVGRTVKCMISGDKAKMLPNGCLSNSFESLTVADTLAINLFNVNKGR